MALWGSCQLMTSSRLWQLKIEVKDTLLCFLKKDGFTCPSYCSSLHMGRIIGPYHLLSLRGFHLPSGASDVIWSGSIKWSGTNQISPCRCTWQPLVKMCWRRWSEADGGASGQRERKPLCHSASLTFFKVLGVKNKAVLEINIKDVCLSWLAC